MENQLAKIFTSIDEHKEDMVQDLRTFADLEGHFEEKDNVLKARTWLQQQLEKEGFACRFREVADDRCGIMIAELGWIDRGNRLYFPAIVIQYIIPVALAVKIRLSLKTGKFLDRCA